MMCQAGEEDGRCVGPVARGQQRPEDGYRPAMFSVVFPVAPASAAAYRDMSRPRAAARPGRATNGGTKPVGNAAPSAPRR